MKTFDQLIKCLLACCIMGSTHIGIGQISKLRINEVRIDPVQTPFQDTLYAFIELYNIDTIPLNCDGGILVNNQEQVLDTLPSIDIPPGGFLVINLGIGTDDLDASDGLATIYTQGPAEGFFATDDIIALYEGDVSMAFLRDFVRWSRGGQFDPGTSFNSAVSMQLWDQNDSVDLQELGVLSTFGICPDGFDHNSSLDWVEFDWGYQISHSNSPSNLPQIYPVNAFVQVGEGQNPQWADVYFEWCDVAYAQDYILQVSTDDMFTNLVHDEIYEQTTETLTLANGLYFWKLFVRDSSMTVVNPNTESWVFCVGDAELEPGDDPGVLLSVPHYFQHKDTELLCITTDQSQDAEVHRHGCDEFAGNHGPWDAAHPKDHAATNCNHCSWYCAHACIQMINHFHDCFGASLTQDRIAYQAFKDVIAGSPERDLGHCRGFSNSECVNVYSWAIGVPVTHEQVLTFEMIKAEIDNGKPLFVRTANHGLVLSGYRTVEGIPQVFVLDPHPSAPSGWTKLYAKGIVSWFKPGAGTITPVVQEQSVTYDADGDDVYDFDENVRGFCCHSFKTDTDEDGIGDKAEIRSYTFHELDHAPGHNNIMGIYVPVDDLAFPDIDGDGNRAECDCDSDHDGDHDGHEDISLNGNSPENADETCVYDVDEFLKEFFTDLPVYVEDANVWLSGYTFQPNMTYDVAILPGCGVFDGTALPTFTTVTTDAFGFFIKNLGPFAVGVYTPVIDLNHTGIYEIGFPHCPDDWTCFEVVAVPPIVGCCFRCDGVNYDCLGSMLQSECDQLGWDWAVNAQCGTPECGLPGCTDPSACNFDPMAFCEDGSCCYDFCVQLDMFDAGGQGWGDVQYNIVDLTLGICVAAGGLEGGSEGTHSLCLPEGCYTIAVHGTGNLSDYSWVLSGVNDGQAVVGSGISLEYFGTGGSFCDPGCTYSDAANFDSTAYVDDGSCLFEIGNTCIHDSSGDGVINTLDLLNFLGIFGTMCE